MLQFVFTFIQRNTVSKSYLGPFTSKRMSDKTASKSAIMFELFGVLMSSTAASKNCFENWFLKVVGDYSPKNLIDQAAV